MREIPGLPGYYITDHGHLYTRCRRGRHFQRGAVYPLRRIYPTRAPNGYFYASIANVHHYLHALVLTAYKGPRPAGYEARHLNGRKTDNRIENLEWGTVSQNQLDRRVHGTSNAGERNGRCRLKWEDAEEIRCRAATGVHVSDIALDFGVGVTTVRDVIAGRTWKEPEQKPGTIPTVE